MLVRLLCFGHILSRAKHTLLHAGRSHGAASTFAVAGQLHGGHGEGGELVHVDDLHHLHGGQLATAGLEGGNQVRSEVGEFTFTNHTKALQEFCHLLLI